MREGLAFNRLRNNVIFVRRLLSAVCLFFLVIGSTDKKQTDYEIELGKIQNDLLEVKNSLAHVPIEKALRMVYLLYLRASSTLG